MQVDDGLVMTIWEIKQTAVLIASANWNTSIEELKFLPMVNLF